MKTVEVVILCSSNGKRNIVSIKEWTDLLCPGPSCCLPNLAFGGWFPPRESPRIGGWGLDKKKGSKIEFANDIK